ncbi:MAG: D-alanyl-D-alanine carboxypeptidase/D-alanyl-D-alanine-endopeptidase [Actinobacteria bacterium]|nr:D-alanyl-D-alanine carboxypeptidase/D-alanyl-D-alanine-endopeptidase [Actinomycetota bacterium]
MRIFRGAATTAILACSLGWLATPVLAQPADPTVDALLANRLANPRIGPAVGLLVVDAATGEVISDHGGSQVMLPASNMKIVTAVTTLAALGADAQLTTRVRTGATPADVVLEGGGDPLLSTADLLRLANLTAKALPAGTPVVVHVDDDRFPDTKRAPGWTGSYIPSVVSSVEALARIWDYSADPSANAARVFVDRLTKKGVPATLGPDADAGEGAVIAEIGHTVGDAVRVMLRISENNVAEVLYRQVAVATGTEASWQGAQTAAEQVLRNLGVNPDGMALRDGSGLSRKDRVSPRFLVDVLRVARVTNPAPFTTMFEPEAMPVAGQTGTLDDRYGRFVTRNARCAQGAVQAKTGTLFDTIGLSGVATTSAGPERLFSILVNDRPQRFSALSTRQALDGLGATITGCWN